MTVHTIRINHRITQEDVDTLVGARISQMYSEYKGRMGYTVTPVNAVVESVDVVQGGVAIQFAGQSQATLVKQAMIVYAKEEKAETTDEGDTDERTEEAD